MRRQDSTAADRAAAIAHVLDGDGPVLKACVAAASSPKGWRINGGDISIKLATTSLLTDEDKEAICDLFNDAKFNYLMKDTASKAAYSTRDVVLDEVMDKLPDCLAGQAVMDGSVTLSRLPSNKWLLVVNFMEVKVKLNADTKTKLLGHVLSGLDALTGIGCAGERCMYQSISATYGCFCRGGGAGCTTLSDVAFVV